MNSGETRNATASRPTREAAGSRAAGSRAARPQALAPRAEPITES